MLLQQLYKKYPSLKIKELHFAFDLPYSYGDLTFSPTHHLTHPRFLSTKYFDARRKQPNVPVSKKDNIVIYDKCRKCKIASPLTRVELRLSREHLSDLKKDNGCIISSESLQEKLVKKIERKMVKLHIKKGRAKLDRLMGSAPKEMSIKAAMQYIRGDDSLLEYLLSHHTPELEFSSRAFSSFITKCKKARAFQSKPYLVPEVKTYLGSISPREKDMITDTISNYNKYDKLWYLKLLKEPTKTHRLSDSDKGEALFMYQLGETQKEIASELGVSESQISRLFKKQGIRMKLIKDSRLTGLFSFGS